MRQGFFAEKTTDLQFEWNAASKNDWRIIQRNFVAAYISSYKDVPLAELKFNEKLFQEVIEQCQSAWKLARGHKEGFAFFIDQIVNPLKYYMETEQKNSKDIQQLLKNEIELLSKIFANRNADIPTFPEQLIKLMILRHYFELDFAEEKHKIDSGTKKIDYLIARFHGQPIAFFVTELNYKSGRVYLRWVTIEPCLHREGLGKLILDQISKRYPGSVGFELYTRKTNNTAISFYMKNHFKEADIFNFTEPEYDRTKLTVLNLPEDDAPGQPELFVSFCKQTRSNRLY